MAYPPAPFDSTIKPGAQAYSKPEELKKFHLGNAPVGPCMVGATYLGFARIDKPQWNGKPFWVALVFVPEPDDQTPETPDDPQLDPNDVIKHYVGGILVEEFYRVIK